VSREACPLCGSGNCTQLHPERWGDVSVANLDEIRRLGGIIHAARNRFFQDEEPNKSTAEAMLFILNNGHIAANQREMIEFRGDLQTI